MNKKINALFLAALCGFFTLAHSALAQGTAFTYQGRLNSGTNAANGNYDISFTLYTNSSGGVAVAGPMTNSALPVTDGLFTANVDFGSVFTGLGTWMEVAVSTNGANAFRLLAPRQQLTPVPYAIFANTASNLSGSVSAAAITGSIPLTQLPPSVVVNGSSGVNISGTFSGNGAGLTGVPGTLTQVVTGSTSLAAQPNAAYDVTNSGLVTINLPAAANVGDVIQVNGAGAGGWQVAGKINGASYAWTEPAGPPSYGQWSSVASSSDGTHLVAVSMNTPGLAIYTSGDTGMTWNGQNVGGHLPWVSVASSSNGTHLVALNLYPPSQFLQGVYTSADSGGTWAGQAGAPTNVFWTSVASSWDGTRLVAVAASAGVYLSTNTGVTWTQTSAPTNVDWSSVASSWDGTHLAALAGKYSNKGAIYTSTNSGLTWIEQTGAPTNASWNSIASSADGTHVVAVDQNIYTSTDSGVTWTQRSSAPTTDWTCVASSTDGTHLVAGTEGAETLTDGIYTSADSGATWVKQTGVPVGEWVSVACSADGLRLVAAANDDAGLYTASPQDVIGAPGTSEEFQYLGNGVWQPLPPAAGYLSGNFLVAQVPVTLVTNGENGVTLGGNFSGSGSGLTSLPANAALLNANQNFTGQNNFSGNVGIGTTTPAAILDVEGEAYTTGITGPFFGVITGGAFGNFNNDAQYVSIKSQWYIEAYGYIAVSDRRIKDIVGQADSAKDLATIERLKVTDYRMKDRLAAGDELHKGFIAQEVQPVIPEAVTKTRNFIPDIYALADKLTYDKGAQTLRVHLAKPHGLKPGDKVQLILADGKMEKDVAAVPDENSFEVGAVTQKPGQVFVYGKQVDDFLAVDYDRIYSTGISAIQELAKRMDKVEARETQLAELEQKAAEVTKLEEEVADLKKMVAQLAQDGKGTRVAEPPAQQSKAATVRQDGFATAMADH